MKEKTRKKRAVAVPNQKEAGPQTFTSARGVRFGIPIILVAINLALFASVRNHDFVNFDDPDYVTDNSVVKQGLTLDGVAWAFTTPYAANWHPLTWLSHMLDIEDMGNVLTEQGKFDAALKQYREALRINPGLVQAHLNLGVLLGIQDKVDEAIVELNEALRINPRLCRSTHQPRNSVVKSRKAR
jgi:tetratricopeptide (TPR) repeat protein